MRPLVIAAVQTRPTTGDHEATWSDLADRVRGIHRTYPAVTLVLFPELHLAAEADPVQTTHVTTDPQAHAVPGPLTDRMAALARETGLWLLPGSIYERGDDGHVYNTALVFSPTGELVARYRKCFPWQPYETSAPGDEFVVFDMPGIGTLGLAICYDGNFPETYRQLAWLGAEVVLQPTLTPTRDRDLELVVARANAIVNQVFVVNLNASAPHGTGQSIIVDPEGIIRQQAGSGDEVLIDVLDLDAVTRVRQYGTFGLNRMWDQMDEHGPNLHLPMYAGGRYQPRTSRRLPD